MTVGAQSKSVHTLQRVVQPVVQPDGQNRVELVEFCNRSNFCYPSGLYATEGKNKYINKNFF